VQIFKISIETNSADTDISSWPLHELLPLETATRELSDELQHYKVSYCCSAGGKSFKAKGHGQLKTT